MMQSYIRAKDEITDYQGPDWVPFNLWQLAQYPHGPYKEVVGEAARKLIESPGAKDVWEALEREYPNDGLAMTLPMRAAEFIHTWRSNPKRTPSEHKKFRTMLKKHANQLASELDHFFESFDSFGYVEAGEDEERGGVPNFTQLLTEEEQDQMQYRINRHHYSCGAGKGKTFDEFIESGDWQTYSFDLYELLIMDDRQYPGIVPDLPTILRRVGELLGEGANRPPLERPNAKNAERNYFARRLAAFFQYEWGKVSPGLVARITSMFYSAAMSDSEVQQQLGRLPSGRLLKKPVGVARN